MTAPKMDEDALSKAAQALFDDSMGGTSDPTLIEMLADISRRNARLVVETYLAEAAKKAEARP